MMQTHSGTTPPEWIHILPAGTFKGDDGRGPYVLRDPQGVIASSMRAGRGKLTLDENHSTDTAAKIGMPAHAMGWIVELQARADGIWGRVEWTPPGAQAMKNHAYRGVSPLIEYDPDGTVKRIMRASLTNAPNLTLTALHHQTTTQETTMDLEAIALALGLPASATQADVERALAEAKSNRALHTSLTGLLNLGADADATAIATGVRARLEGESAHAQALTAVQTELAALKQRDAVRTAEAVVDGAARDGHVISAELRGELVALHATNPEMAAKIIAQLPKIPQGQVSQMTGAAHAAQATPRADAGADPKAVAAMDATFKVTDAERTALEAGNAY